MVATLVIVLPSSHEGGELIVRHEGQERDDRLRRRREADPFQIHFAAFYADCEHEVRPLRKGYRLCLVYNLTLAKSKKPIAAPRDSEHIERPILSSRVVGGRLGREAGHHAGASIHPGRAGLGRAEGRGPRQGDESSRKRLGRRTARPTWLLTFWDRRGGVTTAVMLWLWPPGRWSADDEDDDEDEGTTQRPA